MSTPIEELTALVDALRAETTEQSITPERMGAILQRMIDVLPSISDANSLKGWVAISSINELPSNPSPTQRALAYLLDTTLYVYVGSGGDTLEGKYRSAELKGKKGDKGNDGVHLGDVVLVNNLTEGGEESAQTAEMGAFFAKKVLKASNATSTTIYPTLEQGAMQSDGTKQDSSSSAYNMRVRTKDFIRVYGDFSVSVTNGFSFNVFLYTAQDTSTFLGSLGTWAESHTGSFDGYILIGIRKGNGSSSFTPSAVTLTIIKAVPYFPTLEISLEQGGLSVNGEPYQELPSTSPTHTKRVRSVDLLPVHGHFVLRGEGGKSVFAYDENGIWQKRISTGTWEYGDYSNTHNGYIRITCKKESDADCTPEDFHMTLLNPIESRIESAEKRLAQSGEYNRTYQGESIVVRENKLSVSEACTLPTGLVQCIAVHGDYIIVFDFDSTKAFGKLYRLSSMELLATLNLPNSTYKRAHCNAASFSDVFNTADSIMPLLYVSQWDNDSQKGCFVYDITLNNGTYSVDLVQTILPTNVSTATRGAGQTDWVVDPLGYIYSIGYLVSDGATVVTNNKTMICKYALPAVSDGAVVTFGDEDVLDNFDVPIFTYRQDAIANNGKILMLAGHFAYAPCWLVSIDPAKKQVVTKVSLQDFNQEPEGIGVIDGRLVIGFHGNAVLYRFDFI